MHSLPIFLKLAGRPVILIGDGEAAIAKRRLLERAGAVVIDESGDAQVAIVAVGEDDVAETAVARLKARGILVNATDRPALCDFTMPAIVDRDPVLVAIGTGGTSAGLAKALRIAIEAILPSTLGTLASALANARGRIRAKWPEASARRRAIDTALVPGGVLDPLSEIGPGVFNHWIGSETPETRSEVVKISLHSSDPDDLTLRQARLLGSADRIFHAPDVPDAILQRARADANRIAASPPSDVSDAGLWLDVRFAE